jgi:hypothetical protein
MATKMRESFPACTQMAKVPGIQSPEFLGDYKDSKGRTYKCYNRPKREAELMVMSELTRLNF